MKHKQRWAGGNLLFLSSSLWCVFFLATHMKGAFRAAGHPEIGLLFFILLSVQLPASFHIVEKS